MPILNILIFFAAVIFIALVGFSIILMFHNKRALLAIDEFIGQSSGLNPVIFQHIELRYTESSDLKTYIYPINRCDLYVFDNYLVMVRRLDFGFNVFYAPIMLITDIETTNNIFNGLETYKPDQTTFKQLVKGEVDISLINPIYKHYTIDISFKELTNEQITVLEKFKCWAVNQ
jgi:hypothetical protein